MNNVNFIGNIDETFDQ